MRYYKKIFNKKIFNKKVLIALLIVFVGIQFFPAKRNQSDKMLPTDITLIYNVPKNVQSIFETSCYNCHSNNTVYPWYNKVQPIAWLLQFHIEEGKSELNFNEFGSYSMRKRKSKLKAMANQIKDGDMPLFSYTLMHGDAKITKNKKTLLLNWINKEITTAEVNK